MIRATNRGVQTYNAKSSRALFLLTPVIAVVWMFLVVCSAIAYFLWVFDTALEQGGYKRGKRRDIENNLAIIRRKTLPQAHKTKIGLKDITAKSVELANAELEALEQARSAFKDPKATLKGYYIFILSAFFILNLSTTLFASITFLYGMRFETATSSDALLISNSNGAISNLDQISALIGGCLVLLNAIRGAYKSRVNRLRNTIRRRRSL